MSEKFEIWHFDGQQAVRRNPEIQIVGPTFLLVEQQWRSGPFSFEDLEHIGTQGDTDVYAIYDGKKQKDGWRIGLSGDVPGPLAALLPRKQKYGFGVDRIGLIPAMALFLLISIGFIFVAGKAPAVIAPLVPESWEKQMGDAIVGDFGGRFCRTEQGTAALQKMVDALDEDASDLQVEVVKINMINAAALPGGKIIIFDQLVQDAKSPDEVAGVLGHELGHVRERHVMQSFLRQMGLSVLLGGLNETFGGVVGGVLSMSYGRDAETSADKYSIKAMRSANISPIPTAGFFGKLAELEENVVNPSNDKEEKSAESGIKTKANDETEDADGGLWGYFSTHPLSKKRQDAYANSFDKSKNYQPVLNAAEWKALRNMCREDKDVKGDGSLFF